MERKPKCLDKAWVGLHGMTTGLATQALGIRVKGFEMREEILFDIVQFKVGLVQWVIAGLAKPQETVRKASSSPLAFNHQAQGTFFAYR